MRKMTLAFILLLSALTRTATAIDGSRSLRHSGFYLAPGFSMVSTPLFREPSGNSEAAIPQKNSAVLFAAGWEKTWKQMQFGLRLAYWRNAYDNFTYPEMPNSPYPVYVRYTGPKKTYIFGDIILGWVPDKSGMFTIYGLLGMGTNSESYTLSGSTFPEWDGPQKYSEFSYSFGLGFKVTPVKLLSLYGELRLLPGVSSMKLKYLYSDSTYDYYEYQGTYTSNYTTSLSIGLAINL